MGKIFDKFMNTMRLNGDDYEEEYVNDADLDDADLDDDYDDNDDVEMSDSKKAGFSSSKVSHFSGADSRNDSTSKTASRSSSRPSSSKTSAPRKIVPINNTLSIQELRIIRPSTSENAKEIIDVLLNGQACVINLEGVTNEMAMRITDTVFGGCYALDGNIEMVNNFIFVITPAGLEITGDIQEFANMHKASSVPSTPGAMASGYASR